MNIGPMEVFIIALLCSAPLVAIAVIVAMVIAAVRYRRQQRNKGPFSWPTTSEDDQ